MEENLRKLEMSLLSSAPPRNKSQFDKRKIYYPTISCLLIFNPKKEFPF